MRRVLVGLLLMVTLFGAVSAHASTNIYYSPGLLLTPLGSLRIGGNEWEGGYLGATAVGIDKIFRIPNSALYVSFGPTLPLGIYGGAGGDWHWFRWLSFRAEMGAVGTIINQSAGFFLGGLEFHL